MQFAKHAWSQLPIWLLMVAAFTGCASEATSPVSPSTVNPLANQPALQPPALLQLTPAVQTADISGTWNGRGIVQLTVPPWVAQVVLGITPEGPITHIRCSSSGTMHLSQSGTVFSGSQERAPNVCETRGGQVYSEPKGTVLVLDGRINGRHLEFVLVDGPLRCPQRGVITEIQADGTASQLDGTARCIVPGHPRSDAPPPFDLDPPPAGTSKTLSWHATR